MTRAASFHGLITYPFHSQGPVGMLIRRENNEHLLLIFIFIEFFTQELNDNYNPPFLYFYFYQFLKIYKMLLFFYFHNDNLYNLCFYFYVLIIISFLLLNLANKGE